MSKPILIWKFEEAPKIYQRLSNHGGDEDWIAFIPRHIIMRGVTPMFLEEGTAFGCCDVEKHKVYDGEVWIGAHA
jgi:hypothetical protein